MTEVLTASIATITALVVWYLSKRDLVTRERGNRKKDARVEFLIDAYRRSYEVSQSASG